MFFLKKLVVGNYSSGVEARLFRSFFAINIIAIADIFLHLVFLVVFCFTARNTALIAFQLCMILVCLISLAINHKGIKDAASILLTLEIGVASVVWVVFLGGGCYMQWFALCGVMPHYLFTDIGRKKRVALMIFLTVCINASVAVMYFAKPVVPDVDYTVYRLLTFNAVYFTLVLELLLGNIAANIAQTHFEKTLAREKDMSMKDPLTGLWNRRYIQVQNNPILSISMNLPNCVAILDLDRFKLVNDSYGHVVGDMLLKHFSKLMISSFRSTDVIIRWGGEEFMLLMTGVPLERAGIMLEAFLKKTREAPLQVEEASIAFTFTAGVCEFTEASFDEAVAIADKRLYAGKNAGRNRIVISDDVGLTK